MMIHQQQLPPKELLLHMIVTSDFDLSRLVAAHSMVCIGGKNVRRQKSCSTGFPVELEGEKKKQWQLAFGKIILTDAAQRADKILGNILPLGTGSNALFGVALLLVVFPATQIANIFHSDYLHLFFVALLYHSYRGFL